MKMVKGKGKMRPYRLYQFCTVTAADFYPCPRVGCLTFAMSYGPLINKCFPEHFYAEPILLSKTHTAPVTLAMTQPQKPQNVTSTRNVTDHEAANSPLAGCITLPLDVDPTQSHLPP